MPFIVKMDGPSNLANLPPDIIRIIIAMGDHSEIDLRLISRSWNTLVKQCFAGRQPSHALERVHFRMGQLSSSPDCLSKEAMKEEKQRVIMHAIIPERYSARAGVGKWLKVFNTHSGGAIEVISKPHHITFWNNSRVTLVFITILFCIITCLLVLRSIMDFEIADRVLVIVFCFAITVLAYWGSRKIAAKRAKNRARFARLFSIFSRIEILVLDQFDLPELSYHDRVYVFDALKTTLTGVLIDRVEVRGYGLDDFLRIGIIDLCRNHNISHVFITVDYATMRNISSYFILELIKTGVLVDIYEARESNDIGFINSSRAYWNGIAADLANDGISMKMGGYAGTKRYRVAVRTHIRFEKSDGTNASPLQPVNQLRGYYCW